MKSRVNRALKSAIGHVAAATGAYARSFDSKMIIMAFHRVNDVLPEDGLTCTSAKFEKFCGFFRRHFDVLPLSQQVQGCKSGKDMGGTLSITFDDGYRDNCEVAASILRGAALPATFFVTSGFVGSQTVPPWDNALPVQPGWMTWDQVRSLVAQGFEIGCHTHTHLDMGTAELDAVRADIQASQERFRDELDVAIRLFAYPFGGRANISENSRALVRAAGFECCVSCYGGVNGPSADPFNLRRIAVAEWFASPHQFGYELLTGRLNAMVSVS